MIYTLVFVLPFLFVCMVAYFIFRFRGGVKAGLFQRSIFRRKRK